MARYDAFVTVLSYCVWASKRNKRRGYFNELKIGQKHLFVVFSLNTLFSPQQLKNKKGLIPPNFVEEVAVASPRRLAAAKVSHRHDSRLVIPSFISVLNAWTRPA